MKYKRVRGQAGALLQFWLKVIEGISKFNLDDIAFFRARVMGAVGERITKKVKQEHVLTDRVGVVLEKMLNTKQSVAEE